MFEVDKEIKDWEIRIEKAKIAQAKREVGILVTYANFLENLHKFVGAIDND